MRWSGLASQILRLADSDSNAWSAIKLVMSLLLSEFYWIAKCFRIKLLWLAESSKSSKYRQEIFWVQRSLKAFLAFSSRDVSVRWNSLWFGIIKHSLIEFRGKKGFRALLFPLVHPFPDYKEITISFALTSSENTKKNVFNSYSRYAWLVFVTARAHK